MLKRNAIVDDGGVHMLIVADIAQPGIPKQPQGEVIRQGHRVGPICSLPPLLPVKQGVVLGKSFNTNVGLRRAGRDEKKQNQANSIQDMFVAVHNILNS